MEGGEVTADQCHRGYTIASDESGGLLSLNPLYIRNIPDTKGRYCGQAGYGYVSFERFVRAATEINEGKKTPDDFDDDIADPAYWTKHSEKEGALYSPADFYSDDGIFLSKGNNDRKAGAKIVYEGLEVPDEGEPRIRFTENCLQ